MAAAWVLGTRCVVGSFLVIMGVVAMRMLLNIIVRFSFNKRFFRRIRYRIAIRTFWDEMCLPSFLLLFIPDNLISLTPFDLKNRQLYFIFCIRELFL